MRAVLSMGIVVCVVVASAAQSTEQKFEVVSVKPNSSGPQTGRGLTSPAGRFVARNEPLRSLIAFAFEIDEVRVIAPNWTENSRFDIEATTPATRNRGDLQAMMRALLADRFTLRAHREMRDAPVFKLTRNRPDRLGPQIRAVTIDCQQRTPGQPPPCRTVGLPNGVEVFGREWAAIGLGQLLSRPLERTVVDATGLSGQFDLTLQWSNNSDDGTLAGRVASAVEEQLGMRLSPETVPLEHLVVDDVQRPTPN